MPAFANLFVHASELVDVVIFNEHNEPIERANELTPDQSAEMIASLPPEAVHYSFQDPCFLDVLGQKDTADLDLALA